MSNSLATSTSIATPFANSVASALNLRGFTTTEKHSPTSLSTVVDPTPNAHGFVTDTVSIDLQAWRDNFLTVEIRRYGSNCPLQIKATVPITGDNEADLARLLRVVLAAVQA